MLIKHYEDLLASGSVKHDSAQLAAIGELQKISDRLEQRQRHSRFRYSVNPFKRGITPVKGAYLYGKVGRGKTWLMDQFYQHVEIHTKERYHFHRFMRLIHQRLQQHATRKEPILAIAKEFARRIQLLCLDEFHIIDIGDTMLLRNLIIALFDNGITLVTTSNRKPSELCYDWFQREQFKSASELIYQHTTLINLDGKKDYRLNNHKENLNAIYLTDDLKMAQIFTAKSKNTGLVQTANLLINSRPIEVIKRNDTVCWFEFSALCQGPRAVSDYIEIAKRFDSVLISNVPILNDENKEATRRFISLVDEFYDRQIQLTLSSDHPLDKLYQGTELAFEYERVYSRLSEMHSAQYKKLK